MWRLQKSQYDITEFFPPKLFPTVLSMRQQNHLSLIKIKQLLQWIQKNLWTGFIKQELIELKKGNDEDKLRNMYMKLKIISFSEFRECLAVVCIIRLTPLGIKRYVTDKDGCLTFVGTTHAV
jgi:hypothetical protein